MIIYSLVVTSPDTNFSNLPKKVKNEFNIAKTALGCVVTKEVKVPDLSARIHTAMRQNKVSTAQIIEKLRITSNYWEQVLKAERSFAWDNLQNLEEILGDFKINLSSPESIQAILEKYQCWS